MRLLRLASLLLVTACTGGGQASADANDSSGGSSRPFQVTPITQFAEPWAMTFLPDGRLLVTEKKGALRILNKDGTLGTIEGMPKVAYGGQGGLGDIVLHPKHAANGLIYLSWAEAGEGSARAAVVGRGRLVLEGNGGRVDGLQVIWRQDPQAATPGHFSHRIAFAPDGHMFVTSGERMQMTPAQAMDGNLGKVIRLTETGAVPPGNPFADKGSIAAQFWSVGHRNLLGIAFDGAGRLWTNEMGPRGGDEVNLIQPGKNYGWPVVSNGDNYNGSPIPDHPTRPEFEAPKVWWNPSISPSSLMIYSGKMFPQWQGSAFIGALSGQALIRVALDGTNARKADQWDMGARIREVEQGPDGAIYLLEDERGGKGGRLLKLTPAGS